MQFVFSGSEPTLLFLEENVFEVRIVNCVRVAFLSHLHFLERFLLFFYLLKLVHGEYNIQLAWETFSFSSIKQFHTELGIDRAMHIKLN